MSQQAMKALFCQVSKINEEKRTVTGVGTSDAIDDEGERFHYETSKPYIEAWSQSALKRSQGKSHGNIREMHQLSAAGKVAEPITFDDARKLVILTSYVSDDDAWQKCLDGTYTGYSIRGPVVGEKWSDPDNPGVKFYTCAPIEFSLVDLPCNPEAVFTAVKAGGITEQRKFKAQEGEMAEAEKAKSKKTKKVDGEELPKSAFAYQGSDEPKDWHLPIEFSTNESSANHIRDAISRWDQTSMPDAIEKKTARGRIMAAAKKHGIDVSEESLKAAGGEMDAKAKTDGLDNISKSIKALGSMGDCLNGTCDHAGLAECVNAIGKAHKTATKALSAWADPDDTATDGDDTNEDSTDDKSAKAASAPKPKGASPETGANDMTEAEKAQVAAAEQNSAKALEMAEATNKGMEQIVKALGDLTSLIAGEPVPAKSVTPAAAVVAVSKAAEVEGRQEVAATGPEEVAKSILSRPQPVTMREATALRIGR